MQIAADPVRQAAQSRCSLWWVSQNTCWRWVSEQRASSHSSMWFYFSLVWAQWWIFWSLREPQTERGRGWKCLWNPRLAGMHMLGAHLYSALFFYFTGLHSIYHVPYATLSIFIIIIFFFLFTCPYLYICNSCILCMYVYMYIHVCMYVCVYVDMYVYIYICMCMYIYIYIFDLYLSVFLRSTVSV